MTFSGTYDVAFEALTKHYKMAGDNDAARFVSGGSVSNDLRTLANNSGSHQFKDLCLLSANRIDESLALIAFGFYRPACFALRSSVELFATSIHFSYNIRDYQNWKKGNEDINWAKMCDADEGIFGEKSRAAFDHTLSESAHVFAQLLKNLYRSLSEYVHSNPRKDEVGSLIKYDQSEIDLFFERVRDLSMLASFGFITRFANELSHEQKQNIETVVLDSMGDDPSIRDFFNG